MQVTMAVLIGVLFAAGIYSMLRRSIVKILIGITLLSHGAHLVIFTAGGLRWGRLPLVSRDAETLAAPYADPLPQALVLTAIVINFGLAAFMVALIFLTHRAVGSDDIDEMRRSDR